jgi:hypothetical protein
MVYAYIQFLLSIIVFVMGYYLGTLDKIPISCIPHDFWDNLHQKTIKNSNFAKNKKIEFKSTFVHSNQNHPTLQHVFAMIHHASCPVDTELILTAQSEWNNDYSRCEAMYATRSPVREDQTNRCLAVGRVNNSNSQLISYTDISHRLGVMTWPQKLTDQYQVIIIINVFIL